MEYTIVGDTEEFKGCLIYLCGTSKENAEEVLDRMLTNPNKNDLAVMEGHTNLRIKEVQDSDCWWNEGNLD